MQLNIGTRQYMPKQFREMNTKLFLRLSFDYGYARENKIPYLGLCYGMQLAVIEFAQHVSGIKGATSKELDDKALHQVISIMESQKETLKGKKYGGSMRLGAYDAVLKKGSIVASLYGSPLYQNTYRLLLSSLHLSPYMLA